MIKRIIACLLAAFMLLSTCGCISMLNSEYESVSKHIESSGAVPADSSIPRISDIDELESAILSMVKSHLTAFKVRFENYNGNPEEDTDAACMNVAGKTPLGAYAVSSISGKVNKVISYYQADISIVYKKNPQQIISIIDGTTTDFIDDRIKDALVNSKEELAVRTSLEEVDTEYFIKAVRRMAFQKGANVSVIPTASVAFYPEDVEEHIAELTLTYPFPADQLNNMRESLNSSIQDTVKKITSDSTASDAEMLLDLFRDFSDRIERVSSEEAQDIDNTAYGAYVSGRGTDLGISLAFKIACTQMGFDCYVADGLFKGTKHYWNIVKIDDDYYNCDLYRAGERSIAECIFRSDAEISREYWWDTDAYPKCNGKLNYFIVSGFFE